MEKSVLYLFNSCSWNRHKNSHDEVHATWVCSPVVGPMDILDRHEYERLLLFVVFQETVLFLSFCKYCARLTWEGDYEVQSPSTVLIHCNRDVICVLSKLWYFVPALHVCTLCFILVLLNCFSYRPTVSVFFTF